MDFSDEDFDRCIYWKLKEQRNREEQVPFFLLISDQHLLLILLPLRCSTAYNKEKHSDTCFSKKIGAADVCIQKLRIWRSDSAIQLTKNLSV